MSLQVGIPLMLAAALLQATVLPQITVLGARPDLVLVIALAWSTLDADREGMAWAFAGGLLLDLFSGAPLGLSSLLMVPITWVVGLSEAQVYRDNALLPLLLTAGGSLAYHVGSVLLLRSVLGEPIPLGEALLSVALPSMVFNVLLILPLLLVLERWYARLHPRRVAI